MKITYRIPSKDPYGYVEFEYEDDNENMQMVIDNLEDMMAYHKGEGGAGIPEKDFNAFLDTYLKTGTGSSDVYAQMSKDQQNVIMTIKRSLNRIKYKTNGNRKTAEARNDGDTTTQIVVEDDEQM